MMWAIRVAAPMRMNGAAAVVRCCTVVRMRMDEWPCQGSTLNQQAQRDGYELSHRCSSIVGERRRLVKGTAANPTAAVGLGMWCHCRRTSPVRIHTQDGRMHGLGHENSTTRGQPGIGYFARAAASEGTTATLATYRSAS
jgi:hypothetical protein